MGGAEQLAKQLSELAVGRIPLREFEEWLVTNTWNAVVWAAPELRDAVYSIEFALAEYSNGHRTNTYVRAYAGDISHELKAWGNARMPSSSE